MLNRLVRDPSKERGEGCLDEGQHAGARQEQHVIGQGGRLCRNVTIEEGGKEE